MSHRRFLLALSVITVFACIGCKGNQPPAPPPDPLLPTANTEAKRLSASCIDNILTGRSSGGEKSAPLKDYTLFGLNQDPVFNVRENADPPTYVVEVPFWLERKDDSGERVKFKEKLIVKITTKDNGKSWTLLESRIIEDGRLSAWNQSAHWSSLLVVPTLVALAPHLLCLLPLMLLLALFCFGDAAAFVWFICNCLGIDVALANKSWELWKKFYRPSCLISLLLTLGAAPWVAYRSLDAYPSKETAVICATFFVILICVINQLAVFLHAEKRGLFPTFSWCWLALGAGVAIMAASRGAGLGLSSVVVGGVTFLILGFSFISRGLGRQWKVPHPVATKSQTSGLQEMTNTAVISFVMAKGRYPNQAELEDLVRQVLQRMPTVSSTIERTEPDQAQVAIWGSNSLLAVLIGLGLLITALVLGVS